MIHEIFPHSFNNSYVANQKIGEDDFIFHYNQNTLLFKANGDGLTFPQKKDLSGIPDDTNVTFLFTLDNTPCFLINGEVNTEKSDLIYKEIKIFRNLNQQEIAWAVIAGYHLANWYAQNRFCGKCGSATIHKTDERAVNCSSCDTIFYPKISPAIIVAIICNDKILLACNSNFPARWYSLIAGYVDIGEPLEETVRRETKEEVGLDVRNIRYYKSQPWPLTGSLMVGFIAEADDTQPIILETKELTEAAWFTRGNLPNYPPGLGISGEMISKFDKGEL
ncbi:MAG: NAD(+) diphosphatase [Chitinispirillaceae bacterium]|nr:NAD(+) diphosphatase [Chitinispirillaceae bacterium]